MIKTALTRLQDEIDAVRQEAFAEGFAAAMRAVREFSAQPPPAAVSVEADASAASDTQPVANVAAPPKPRRLPRGTNAKLVELVLRSIAPRAARPTEIRDAVRRERGVALAFTSIRHALGQLEARHKVEHVPHGKTWRYLAGCGHAGGGDA